MGLFAKQKCAIFENHGSMVFGRYLSCSIKPPGVFCQVLWSGMLGVGCNGQRQLGSNQTYKALPGGPRRNLFRWKGMDREIIKTQSLRLTTEGPKKPS